MNLQNSHIIMIIWLFSLLITSLISIHLKKKIEILRQKNYIARYMIEQEKFLYFASNYSHVLLISVDTYTEYIRYIYICIE